MSNGVDPKTPFLGLTKPIVGDEAGEDLWGDKLNRDLDLLDANAVSVSDSLAAIVAGAMTDAPSNDVTYGRKNAAWVDVAAEVDVTWDQVTGKPPDFPPADHTHPWADIEDPPPVYPPEPHNHPTAQVIGLDTALDAKEPSIAAGDPAMFWAGDKTWKVVAAGGGGLDQAAADIRYVNVTGDTMSGPLTISHTLPCLNFNQTGTAHTFYIEARSQNSLRWMMSDFGLPVADDTFQLYRYNDAGAYAGTVYSIKRSTGVVDFEKLPTVAGVPLGGGAATAVADTPPGAPVSGQLWVNSTSMALNVWYADPNTSQWVEIGGASAGPKSTISTSAPSGGADGDVWYQVP